MFGVPRKAARVALFTSLVVMVMLVTGPVASAKPTAPSPCTIGEAKSNFEAPYDHFVRDDLAVRFRCQYRVFFDGRAFTYCEDDVILAGTIWFENYQALGLTRDEAIAFYERYEDRVWIDGIEQPLERTAWKDADHPVVGPVVFQQRGFITKLPVGDHISHYESTFDGNLDGTATVMLHILPRTDAACS
jgi:hypothetical protein